MVKQNLVVLAIINNEQPAACIFEVNKTINLLGVALKQTVQSLGTAICLIEVLHEVMLH